MTFTSTPRWDARSDKVELADIVRAHGAAFRAAHRLCPVQHRALRAIERCRTAALGGEFPIIGVGGILSGADAVEKLDAGATLVQIYTGLIYRGPELVNECIETIRDAHRPASRDQGR